MLPSLTLRDRSDCNADYEQLVRTQSYVEFQNALLAPNADDYVRQLLQESSCHDAPAALLQGQLAVVTGVSSCGSTAAAAAENGSVGFCIAQELALQCGMHVILLGKSATSLERCVTQLRAEAVRRKNTSLSSNTAAAETTTSSSSDVVLPKLYTCPYRPSSLQSVQDAADFCESVARTHHDQRLAILVNASTVGCDQARLTENDMEYNVGCNWIAAHYLTRRLLPLLLRQADVAAAVSGTTSSSIFYRPRVILTSSIGHVLGRKFNPSRFIQCPAEGGAPPGYLVWNPEAGTLTNTEAEQQASCQSMPWTGRLWRVISNGSISSSHSATAGLVQDEPDWQRVGTQVGRSKMAVLADAMHMAKLYPQLCITSHHPGLCTPPNNRNRNNDSESKRLHRLTPSQAARAALRAALDPEFNTFNKGYGYYLHCDGQPWHPFYPTARNRTNGEPIDWEDYCAAVFQAAEVVLVDLGFPPSVYGT